MIVWIVLGCALLVAAIVVIVRTQGVSLGPYSMRLAGIGAALAGYYLALGWIGHRVGSAYGNWPLPHYLVPILAGLGALFCIWRVVQNWQTEMHGLVKGLVRLIVVLILAVLARLCLSH